MLAIPILSLGRCKMRIAHGPLRLAQHSNAQAVGYKRRCHRYGGKCLNGRFVRLKTNLKSILALLAIVPWSAQAGSDWQSDTPQSVGADARALEPLGGRRYSPKSRVL